MASNLARNAPMIAAAGGIYVAACYIGYSAVQKNKADIEETELALQTGDNFSFISNPNRTDQFQNVAAKYDDEIGRDESVMGINLLRRSLLYFHAKGTVLEVGAGTGRNIPYYPSSSVDRVLMTDSSDKMLAQARKKIQNIERPKFACRVGDCTTLDEFPDQCFDTVVDTFGLCSYQNPVDVLREMKRVCKPDGKILLLEHGRSKTWDFITKYLDKNAERHAKNWGCVWNRDLDQIVEESGLQLETLHTWHFGTTYYMVCRPGTAKR
ncbi:methyltransferase type 11 domain containing protein [Nitzschia inconspicua]|uniref:Methyltransferase type 11 domain containing protein n=1 Tax=Nitzschia inconspicua TaxID=303405 RepID=A0A9K3PVG5_9STRA|nr:methyltransferase type 11 domain containing protein [Nitzschia inconspicua]